MSEEESTTPDLVELTRRAIECGARREVDEAMSFYGPDPAWDLSPTGLGTYQGLAAIRSEGDINSNCSRSHSMKFWGMPRSFLNSPDRRGVYETASGQSTSRRRSVARARRHRPPSDSQLYEILTLEPLVSGSWVTL
jgi:hypothetical protein